MAIKTISLKFEHHKKYESTYHSGWCPIAHNTPYTHKHSINKSKDIDSLKATPLSKWWIYLHWPPMCILLNTNHTYLQTRSSMIPSYPLTYLLHLPLTYLHLPTDLIYLACVVWHDEWVNVCAHATLYIRLSRLYYIIMLPHKTVVSITTKWSIKPSSAKF